MSSLSPKRAGKAGNPDRLPMTRGKAKEMKKQISELKDAANGFSFDGIFAMNY